MSGSPLIDFARPDWFSAVPSWGWAIRDPADGDFVRAVSPTQCRPVHPCGRIIAWACLFVVSLAPSIPGANTLFRDGFETEFPDGWSIGDANTNSPAVFWRNVNAAFGGAGAVSGNWKAYCAGTLYPFNSTEANPLYADHQASFMERSVNLAGVERARLVFASKIPSLADCCDQARVVMDGVTVWTQGTPTVESWSLVTVDLTAFAGAAHTLRFEFDSDASGTAEGWYVDDIQLLIPPANDRFANATAIAGEFGSVAGSTVLAGFENTEPPGAPDVGSAPTVWYRWVAPANQCFTFTAPRLGGFDAALHVFSGTALTNLLELNGGTGDPAGDTAITFQAEAGKVYWIRVAGFPGTNGGAEADFYLSWDRATVPPENDAFAGARILSGGSGSVMGNNCNATAEAAEPATNAPTTTVWFQWISPGNCHTVVDTEGSGFDTRLWVFQGSGLAALTFVGFNDDWFGVTSRVQFTTGAGTTNWIRVDGYGGSAGNLRVNWGCPPEQLTAALTGTTLTLSWTNQEYHLQSASALDGPATVWVELFGGAPVELPLTSTNRFFRLTCP